MSKTILIIDDDRALVKIVDSCLTTEGFKTQIAYDGDEGLAKLKESKPDLIILDIHMPRMNGYNFILEAKKTIDIKTIPIIILTAKEGMDELFKVEGIKEYCVKPFQPEWLMEKIHKHIK